MNGIDWHPYGSSDPAVIEALQKMREAKKECRRQYIGDYGDSPMIFEPTPEQAKALLQLADERLEDDKLYEHNQLVKRMQLNNITVKAALKDVFPDA